MNCSDKEKNNRILVLDDEADVRDFLRIYLSSLGWSVTQAVTPSEALAALEQNAHFLVLADIAMPEMDGYEFVTELRAKQIKSQIALMTGFGYNPNHTLVKINKTIRFPCLFKPFNRNKLVETVQNAHAAYHRDLCDPVSGETPPAPTVSGT